MEDYIISKTTVETFGIKAESLAEANKAAQSGDGDLINVQTSVSVRPRPTRPDVSSATPAPTLNKNKAGTAATVTRPGQG